MKDTPIVERWHNWSGPMLFEGDFKAWLKSLSPKARAAEAQVEWTDLSPFTISAYGLHLGLIAEYRYKAHRNILPTVLPDDCTPEGFYLRAIETRRRQIGLHNPFTPTPYERLSEFSHFMYRSMAERVATAAGFTAAQVVGDGLDDGLGEPTEAEDGLNDGLDDGLDDGVSRARLLYHAESESYVECADEFEAYELMNNSGEDVADVTGIAHHEAAFRGDDGLGDGL